MASNSSVSITLQPHESDTYLYILALFLPPVAVTLKAGCGSDSLINSLLMLLGWLPAVCHAFWVLSTKGARSSSPSSSPYSSSYPQSNGYAYGYRNQPIGPSTGAPQYQGPYQSQPPYHPQREYRSGSGSDSASDYEEKKPL